MQWTSENMFTVTAATPITLLLAGRNEQQDVTSTCRGTFTVEVFTGTLP